MDSSRRIEDAAAAWIMRRDSGRWSSDEDVELQAWLTTSVAHRVAFLRLEAAWEHSLRLQALGAGKRRGTIPRSGDWRVSPFFAARQSGASTIRSGIRWKYAAVAASLLLVIAGSWYLRLLLDGDRYSTPIGAMASIALQDGSNVTLNTASKIRVALTKRERLIKLEGGEVFFDVAKDVTRPFIVEAGDRRIVAVGTRFSVRRDGDEVQIAVTEGKVRVETMKVAVAPTMLAAGAIARSQEASLKVHTSAPREVETALSWQTGYLTFDTIPLSDAVAEFNRYMRRKIVIRDPSVAALRVSGKFRTTNADAFVRVLHSGFGIQAQVTDDAIVLTQ